MKKLILSLILASILIGFAPAVKAVDLPPISQMTQSEKNQWIQLLTKMIMLLQEQLKVMVAQEAALAQQNALNQIAQNTQPIVQNTAPTPITPTPAQTTSPVSSIEPTTTPQVVIVPPTINATAVNGSNKLIKLTIKAGTETINLKEVKLHIISNDIKDSNTDFHITSPYGFPYAERINGEYYYISYVTINPGEGYNYDISYWVTGSTKGTFQVSLDFIKVNIGNEPKQIDFNILSPVINIQ